ncbi:MAG: leucine-rich repeat domain-containing protein, partial [Clostridia bacterium]|nr:leucine-rich repeat domain-containing protein [Clostridia bacterium]
NSFNTLKTAAAAQGVTLNSAKECLVRIQIPTYVVEINQQVAKFENFTKLKEARFGTHLVRIQAQNAFTGCSSLEFVSDISHMTQINNATFTGCSNLNIHINWPAAVTTMNSQMFSGSAIKSITIPEGVTTIGQTAFDNCDQLTEIILPNTLTSVGKMAFANCANLETVSFGAGFTTFSSPNHDFETFLYTSSIKYIYLPNNNYSFVGHATAAKNIFNQGKNVTFFFTGSFDEAQAFKADFHSPNDNINISSAELVAFDPTINYNGYADSLGKNLIVYNYSKCDAFYNGVHSYEANTCVEICSVCKDTKVLDNPIHALKVEISYTKYTVEGTKHVYCTNNGCTMDETLVAPALFEFVGYSTNEEGTELCVGYGFNRVAIAEYNEANGKNIQLGVVATIIDEGESLSLSYNEGVVSSNLENTVIAPVNSTYVGVDFKLTGFKDFEEGDTVDLKALNLIMCAYAYDGEFYFIGSADAKDYCEKSASTVTFATIENKVAE